MNHIPISILLLILACLLLISAFFSGSETALMSLNRYRLRHLVTKKNIQAIRASRLLEKPERLIGLILLGNNFVNILASAIATVIAIRLWGEAGIAAATLLLTLIVLIFAEVTPKTIAIRHPEKIAFTAAWVYEPLLKILYPFIWVINTITQALLSPFGILKNTDSNQRTVSHEELRTIVIEADKHKAMLLGILDLEKITVEDIMIPRNEISGIDINDNWDDIIEKIPNSPYTRLPVYKDSIDHVEGFVHLRKILPLFLNNPNFNKENLRKLIRPPYFIPKDTPLNQQLINFQQQRRRIGFIVDEYGDVIGLVTLEDILEEIVGEFTTDPIPDSRYIHPQQDGCYLVDGSMNIRSLNKMMQWTLPTDGPKTLNGLLLEYLEHIPENPVSLILEGYTIEILQIKGSVIKTVKIIPMEAH